MNFHSINPFTEEALAHFDFASATKIETALQKSQQAFSAWKKRSVHERGVFFSKLALLIEQHSEEMAKLAATEMGKLKREAEIELNKCVKTIRWYVVHAESILKPELLHAENGSEISISYEPLGSILGIFPWNFPYWQILRSVIPTVLAGNTFIVKPAPNVPQCSLYLQRLVDEAGFETGIIQTLLASNEQVSHLIQNPIIKAVTLTGSEKAGAAVSSQASQHIKKSVLELGGSDAFIVLPDVDVTEIVKQAVAGRFQNNGQSCVASKRFLLHESVATSFLSALVKHLNTLKVGNPLEEESNIGPLARKDLRDTLSAQMNEALKNGATLLYQHDKLPEKGWFYPPTILGNADYSKPVFRQEFFGPVMLCSTFNTNEEAIEAANATDFGLGCSIWSPNTKLARQLATEIESGMVYINQIVKSDVRFPFGGIKRSGFGRELGSFGLKEFCNIKTTWVKEAS